MKKIYIDRFTNKVSQIIQEDFYGFNELYDQDTFGDRFYMIEAEDKEVKDHGYVLNGKTLLFDRIEGYVEEGMVEVKSTDDRVRELENELAEMKSLLKSLLDK